jgi:hypothetical protein
MERLIAYLEGLRDACDALNLREAELLELVLERVAHEQNATRRDGDATGNPGCGFGDVVAPEPYVNPALRPAPGPPPFGVCNCGATDGKCPPAGCVKSVPVGDGISRDELAASHVEGRKGWSHAADIADEAGLKPLEGHKPDATLSLDELRARHGDLSARGGCPRCNRTYPDLCPDPWNCGK